LSVIHFPCSASGYYRFGSEDTPDFFVFRDIYIRESINDNRYQNPLATQINPHIIKDPPNVIE
jgi:hypothetical protein